MIRSVALSLLLVFGLAGCAEPEEGQDPVEDDQPDLPPLHGWVFDEAIRPLADVRIDAIENGQASVSNADGYYSFEGLPVDRPVILVAELEGYEPLSKQVTLEQDGAVRLNFTLVKIPEAVPYSEALPFKGFISCQAHVVTDDDSPMTDCSGGAQQDDTWEFTVGPELAGAVVEIGWEPSTQAAESMYAKLETLGFGDQNILLAETLGGSVLRLQVAEDVAAKYYSAGGKIRLSVHVSPNVDENEAGIGAGLAVNQDFDAIASLFYIEPPSPTYTVTG